MQAKVEIKDVKIGMFVAELDIPWTESPFLMQGFLISSPEDLEEVRSCCQYIYVDPDRSEHAVRPMMDVTGQKSAVPQKSMTEITLSKVVSDHRFVDSAGKKMAVEGMSTKIDPDYEIEHQKMEKDAPVRVPSKQAKRTPKEAHNLLRLPGDFVSYETTSPLREEYEHVKDVHTNLESAIAETFSGFQQDQTLDLKKVEETTGDMVSSMVRNPDAAHLLCLLKEKDSFTYSHSIAASILAVLFGRHLGMAERDLNTLAMSLLLVDIGKTRLPSQLLEKKGKILPAEAKILRQHVQFSMDILATSSEISPEILAVVEGHHERFDGKGYPHGLEGDTIPVFARIAAIIDFYDAVTHERPYRRSVSPSFAVNALYERQGTQFQAELVEEFIQCLGVYPTGSIVLLSSGEVGIVIEQNELRRLRPIILIVRDETKSDVEYPFTRDLDIDRFDSNGERLFILMALEPGAYGISDEDYYL